MKKLHYGEYDNRHRLTAACNLKNLKARVVFPSHRHEEDGWDWVKLGINCKNCIKLFIKLRLKQERGEL